MIKRAGIYIRVSSERQAEKVSPQVQEMDCRSYCEARGYQVVGVYRDIERYRVGKKLVDPSGTRSDRPQFKRMLIDCADNTINVIIAWKEDRLYRSIRPMLDLLDCIEKYKVDVELVKETFDRQMAPIKAAIARMELTSKDERTKMGMHGRLEQGKVWANLPYGYRKEGDIAVVEPEEAKWVQSIWKWYADGVGTREIRQMLVSADAVQRTQRDDGVSWRLSVIYRILHNESYHTGIQVIKWDGRRFEIPLPRLIDPMTTQCVFQRFEQEKDHPARNIKNDYLALGLVYCSACGVKMLPRTFYKRSKGVLRKTPTSSFRCSNNGLGYHNPGCARTIGTKKLADQLWEKVWDSISGEKFEEILQERIAELQAQGMDSEVSCERLERELEDLSTERQKVIAWARKNIITEDDLQTQLTLLTLQENAIRRELAEKRLLTGDRANHLLELAIEYREQVKAGWEVILSDPVSQEQEKRQFEFKKMVVQAIVSRIEVHPDKSIDVHFDLDLPKVVDISNMTL